MTITKETLAELSQLPKQATGNESYWVQIKTDTLKDLIAAARELEESKQQCSRLEASLKDEAFDWGKVHDLIEQAGIPMSDDFNSFTIEHGVKELIVRMEAVKIERDDLKANVQSLGDSFDQLSENYHKLQGEFEAIKAELASIKSLTVNSSSDIVKEL